MPTQQKVEDAFATEGPGRDFEPRIKQLARKIDARFIRDSRPHQALQRSSVTNIGEACASGKDALSAATSPF